MKSVFLLSLLVCTTAAQASFEMLLIPNNQGRVQRYDAESAIPLGSYAGGPSSLKHSTYISSKKAVVSLDAASGTLRAHNPYSGAFYGEGNTFTGVNFVLDYAATGQIIAIGGNTIRILDANTLTQVNASTTIFAPNTDWKTGVISGSNAYLYGFNTITGNMATQVIALNTLTSLSAATFAASPSAIGGAVRIGNTVTFCGNNGGTNTIYKSTIFTTSVNSIGAIATPLLGFSALSTTAPTMLLGHTSMYAVGTSSTLASTTRVSQFSLSSLVLNDSYELTNAAMAPGTIPGIIVAPEPATMLMLGLGLAGLARRKKLAKIAQ